MNFIRNSRNKSFITNIMHKRFTQNAYIPDIKLQAMITTYKQYSYIAIPIFVMFTYMRIKNDEEHNVPIEIQRKHIIENIIACIFYQISLPYYCVKNYIIGYKKEQMIKEQKR